MERIGYGAGRGDGSQGMAIADRLAHGDDIRYDALALESPKVGTCSAEAGLYLIGNTDAPRAAHEAVVGIQIPRGQNDLSAATDHGFA